MAYMNQEKKAKIAEQLKKVVPKDWKYTLSVHNHSTLCMTVKSVPFSILEEVENCIKGNWPNEPHRKSVVDSEYYSVNPYHYEKAFKGSLGVVEKIMGALNTGKHNNSDIMTDYFDVGHYVELSFGKWDKKLEILEKQGA